jgi:hypothetical protein
MLTKVEREEEISEITSHANKAAMTADAIDALISHKVPDAVYWVEGQRPHAETCLAALRPGERGGGAADATVRQDAQRHPDERDAVRGELERAGSRQSVARRQTHVLYVARAASP